MCVSIAAPRSPMLAPSFNQPGFQRMRSNRVLYCLSLILPCALAVSCVAMRAGSDYYSSADFSGYREYVWMDESAVIQARSGRIEISPLTVRRVRDAIERELAAKNFTQVDARDQADFAVSFTVGARDMISVDDYPEFYRGQWRWRPPYYWPNVDVSMYTEGTLAIDVFDNATREPVWHGWARKRITGADVEDPEATIDNAVDAIFAEFPPSAPE